MPGPTGFKVKIHHHKFFWLQVFSWPQHAARKTSVLSWGVLTNWKLASSGEESLPILADVLRIATVSFVCRLKNGQDTKTLSDSLVSEQVRSLLRVFPCDQWQKTFAVTFVTNAGCQLQTHGFCQPDLSKKGVCLDVNFTTDLSCFQTFASTSKK